MHKTPKKTSKQVAFVSILGIAGISLAGYFGAVSNTTWQIDMSPAVLEEGGEEIVGEDARNAFREPANDSGVVYLKTPEPMYAIYMTQCVVGTRSFRESLVAFIEETPLNAVIIDVKDFSGTLGFVTGDPQFADAELVTCGARDMKEFLATLKEKGIYTIARITVFQDPFYAARYPDQAVQSISRPGEPWKDHKGLAFIDVSSRDFWEYIVAFSKHTRAIGFDELNFDYVRYPSDGPMSDARYIDANKPEALEKFFKYLHQELRPTGAILSADLFGMTTTNTDDLNIGQQLERALPYFDYIAPMVYPSHYPKGFLGLENPNHNPHRVVHYSMEEAVRRTVATETRVRTLDGKPIMRDEIVPAHSTHSGQATATAATTTRSVHTGLYTKESYSPLKLRPWLQDFNYGKVYTADDIEAQVQATYDAGLTSWYFWDPANRYTSLREYLESLD